VNKGFSLKNRGVHPRRWPAQRTTSAPNPCQPAQHAPNAAAGPKSLLRWAAAALGGDQARAQHAACAILQGHASRLQHHLARSHEAAAQMHAAGDRDAPSAQRQADLEEVAQGGVRALLASAAALGCAAPAA